ncbi:MAG: nitroreductase family protein [candidate division WOR-3 bacterium]|nr:nitroreductase family protein [candidate division WOR-3 bacterium]
MDIYQAVLNRHSARRFKPDNITDELIAKVLEAARWAPSWRNNQCWQFIIIRDKPVIEILFKGSSGKFFNAPVYIVACADPTKSGKREGIDYYIADVASAIENLLLAATAEGLGTCWIGAISHEESIRQILEIPSPLRVVAIIPLGFPAEDFAARTRNFVTNLIIRNRSRKELSEFCHMNKFGNRFSIRT